MYARQADDFGYNSYHAPIAESYRLSAQSAAAAASSANAEDQDGYPDDYYGPGQPTEDIDTPSIATKGIGLKGPKTAVVLTNKATVTSVDISETLSITGYATQTAWRTPKWHSYVPTKLRTTTAAAAASTTDSPKANPDLGSKHSSHTSPNTAVIAGVVVPIILILLTGLGALACHRRRRRRKGQNAATDAAASTSTSSSTSTANVVEKVAAKQLDDTTPMTIRTNATTSPRTHIPPQLPQLVLNSPQNPTYFTGLDTFSLHSAATTEDPPPPYRAHSLLSNRSNPQTQHHHNHHQETPTIQTISSRAISPMSSISPSLPPSSTGLDAETSPFDDTQAITTPFTTRSASVRSFASTLYSSNASVYQARPERMSSGNPAEYFLRHGESDGSVEFMLRRDGGGGDGGGSLRVRSPFEDPE